jgi:hypothetical protein
VAVTGAWSGATSSSPLAGVVSRGGQPVPEVHVAVRLGEPPLAVSPGREELPRGEDLVEPLTAPALNPGESPLPRDRRAENKEAGVVASSVELAHAHAPKSQLRDNEALASQVSLLQLSLLRK